MADTKRIHLGFNGKGKEVGVGYSRRGVQYRDLTAAQVQHARDLVGPKCNEGTTVMQYDDMVASECLEQMIVAFTDPCQPEKLPEAKWTTVNAEQMHELLAGETFTAKDREVLTTIFKRSHTVTKSELDDIMGGIVGVVD